MWFTDQEIRTILLTLKVALISTAVTLPLSVIISWFLARKKFKAKIFIESLITIPLVAPPVVTGYLLLLLLGSNSLIGGWLNSTLGIKIAFDFPALVIASVVVSLPLSIRTMKTAFELVNPEFEQASRVLGVSEIATFFRITLPMALPGIISGTVLAFARCLGEFGATIVFAGNVYGKTETIALRVYNDMQIPGREDGVLRLIIVSITISVLAIALSEYYNRKNRYYKRR
ncbi:MAG: molybdate ABC transporter permease subunit [Bacteroidales bacterium]|jgi:molybdate transport system permease protein|nr:molybdate ABC transporter permease subunit [Bacteroidales bacterium]